MGSSGNCFKCANNCVFKEDKQKLFGFPCDMCSRVICQDCNKIMAQEIRVIPSSSRSMIHLCPECLVEFQQFPKLLKQIPIIQQELKECMIKLTKLDMQISLPDNVEIMDKMRKLENELHELKKSPYENQNLVSLDPPLGNPVLETIEQKLKTQSEEISYKLNSVVEAIKDTNKELIHLCFAPGRADNSAYVTAVKKHGMPSLIQNNQADINSTATPSLPIHENEEIINSKIAYQDLKNKYEAQQAEILCLKNDLGKISIGHNISPSRQSKDKAPNNAANEVKLNHSEQETTQEVNQSRKQNLQASKPKSIVGKKITNEKLTAARPNSQTTVFISKISIDATDQILMEYLKANFGSQETFNIENVTIQSGDYKAFKVGARSDLEGKLLDPLNWPEGILIQKFKPFRSNAPRQFSNNFERNGHNPNYSRRSYHNSQGYKR